MGDGVIERCGGERGGIRKDIKMGRAIWERWRGREIGRGGKYMEVL